MACSGYPSTLLQKKVVTLINNAFSSQTLQGEILPLCIAVKLCRSCAASGALVFSGNWLPKNHYFIRKMAMRRRNVGGRNTKELRNWLVYYAAAKGEWYCDCNGDVVFSYENNVWKICEWIKYSYWVGQITKMDFIVLHDYGACLDWWLVMNFMFINIHIHTPPKEFFSNKKLNWSTRS